MLGDRGDEMNESSGWRKCSRRGRGEKELKAEAAIPMVDITPIKC